jgi:hypothetical protein
VAHDNIAVSVMVLRYGVTLWFGALQQRDTGCLVALTDIG